MQKFPNARHSDNIFFLCLPTKDKPRILGIGGPLLFPDCLSDGKKSQQHEVDATGMFMRTSSGVRAYLFSDAEWHDMSVQKPQRHSEPEIRQIYEVERNSKPDEELEQKIRACRYGRDNHHDIREAWSVCQMMSVSTLRHHESVTRRRRRRRKYVFVIDFTVRGTGKQMWQWWPVTGLYFSSTSQRQSATTFALDRMSKRQKDYKIKARASCNRYVDIHDRWSDRNMTAWVFRSL